MEGFLEVEERDLSMTEGAREEEEEEEEGMVMGPGAVRVFSNNPVTIDN